MDRQIKRAEKLVKDGKFKGLIEDSVIKDLKNLEQVGDVSDVGRSGLMTNRNNRINCIFQPYHQSGQYDIRRGTGDLRRRAVGRGLRAGRGRARPIRCFECGWNGHMSRECPTPSQFRCYLCQGLGHIARDCPSKRKYILRHAARDHPRCYGNLVKRCSKLGNILRRYPYVEDSKRKDRKIKDSIKTREHNNRRKYKDSIRRVARRAKELMVARSVKIGFKSEGPTSNTAAMLVR